MTVTDIFAALAQKGVHDFERVKQMTRRKIYEIYFPELDGKGNVKPSGRRDTGGMPEGMDYLALIRGVPRIYWPWYRREYGRRSG